MHKKHLLGNKMFNECMCQGFLRRCRLLLSIFQTRICNGETTGVEWFVFISAICVTFKKWSLRVHVCMCTGARACGHTFIGVWDFQCASARGSWRQRSVRKVHLLWKPFGSCLVGQDFLCNFWCVVVFLFFLAYLLACLLAFLLDFFLFMQGWKKRKFYYE